MQNYSNLFEREGLTHSNYAERSPIQLVLTVPANTVCSLVPRPPPFIFLFRSQYDTESKDWLPLPYIICERKWKVKMVEAWE